MLAAVKESLRETLHDACLLYAAGIAVPEITIEEVGSGSQPLPAGADYPEIYTLRITIEGLGSTDVEIAANPPDDPELLEGWLLLLSSGHGTGWWTGNSGSDSGARDWLDSDVRAGKNRGVLLARWVDGWDNRRGLANPASTEAGPGPALCAAYGAALIGYLRARYCTPTVDDLRVVGNSAGGSLLAYLFCHYGLGGSGLGDEPSYAIRRGVCSSGPPHAALEDGCLGRAGYDYDDDEEEGPNNAAKIDDAYDFDPGTIYGSNLLPGGPATRHDATQNPGWAADSVENGRYRLFSGTLSIADGGKDTGVAPLHGNRLVETLTPRPLLRWSGSSGHSFQGNPAGRAILLSLLFDDPEPAGLRQQGQDEEDSPTTTFEASLPFPTADGTVRIAALGCTTAGANVPDVDGWERLTDPTDSTFGSTRSLTIWKSTRPSSTFSIELDAVAAGTLVITEVDAGISDAGTYAPFIDVYFLTDPITGTDTFEIGPTTSTAQSSEYALAFLATSGGNYSGTWTNDYLSAIGDGFRLSMAVKVLTERGAQDTTTTMSSPVNGIGAIVTIGRDPVVSSPTQLDLVTTGATYGELL